MRLAIDLLIEENGGQLMKFAEYDYQPETENGPGGGMDHLWDSHWKGREGLKVDMTDEALWPTISDIVERPGRLLEAGCGTGQWVQFFARLGHDAIGIDFAASGLEVGRKHNSSLELIQVDFRKLSFADDSFDYITSFGAVEHNIGGPEDGVEIDGVRVFKMCRRDAGLPGLRFLWPRWTSLNTGLRYADADV